MTAQLTPSSSDILLKKNNNYTLTRSVVFLGKCSTENLVEEFLRGHNVLVDGTDNLSHLKSSEIFNPLLNDLTISLKSFHAFQIDILQILSLYLLKKTSFHPLQCEQILSVVHEAYKNALLWSNLELKSSKNAPRPLNFGEKILEKLKIEPFRSRKINLVINKNSEFIEFCINVEGAPIHWREKKTAQRKYPRGTQIIKLLSDSVVIEEMQRTIKIYFYT